MTQNGMEALDSYFGAVSPAEYPQIQFDVVLTFAFLISDDIIRLIFYFFVYIFLSLSR
jgi:hypothetical protein